MSSLCFVWFICIEIRYICHIYVTCQFPWTTSTLISCKDHCRVSLPLTSAGELLFRSICSVSSISASQDAGWFVTASDWEEVMSMQTIYNKNTPRFSPQKLKEHLLKTSCQNDFFYTSSTLWHMKNEGGKHSWFVNLWLCFVPKNSLTSCEAQGTF